MSKLDPFEAVQRFKVEVDRGRNIREGGPGWPEDAPLRLAMALIAEEWEELQTAVDKWDFVETVDAAVDLAYVAIGFLVSCGVDPRPVFEEVHRTNMLKVGAPDNAMGKILKPPGWSPPDVAGSIRPLPALS